MPGCQNFSLSNLSKIGIIGNGNVAMDVARILSSPIERLSSTDISCEALEQLQISGVKEIDVIGRRGAVQSAMTVKELRHLFKIPGLSLRVFQDEIDKSLNFESKDEAKLDSVQVNQQERARKRLFDLINAIPRTHDPNSRIKLNLRFLLSPSSYAPPVLSLNKNSLQGKAYNQIPIPTNEIVDYDYDLLIRSIGYSSVQIDQDLPFNFKEGIVDNQAGRVHHNSYVAGWARTGPFGVIDTTMRSVFVSFI